MGSLTPRGEATGTKAVNDEWFATDLDPGERATRASKFKVTIAVDAAVIIETTNDSGTNWCALNAGVALAVNNLYTFDVAVRNGDKFNMKTSTTGGCTILICRVDEVIGEG